MAAKFALIVAVETYQDKKITPVTYAENDATQLSLALQELEFDSSCQVVLLNADATKATIESKLRTIAGQLPVDDEFIFFYAGHGFSENDHNYITCYDTQWGDLTYTSISLQSILQTIRSSKSGKKILFLDCCHSGVLIDENMRGLLADFSDDELTVFLKDAEFCVGFSSCKTDEKSYPSSALKHGIWTYHLVQALKGKAPPALERGGMLTGSSLQSYLAVEVPRTLRKARSDGAVQNPRFFGNASHDFLIADIRPVLEACRAKAQPHLQQLKRVLFSRERIGNVRSLSGFVKGHHVPDRVSSTTESFLARISSKDVEEEANEFFRLLREKFGYKRQDIECSVNKGSASILTKDFEVSIIITLNAENPSEYIWRVEVFNIRNPAIVESEEFNNVFPSTFTALEFEPVENISVEQVVDAIENLNLREVTIDYPADLSSCTIKIEGFSGNIFVSRRIFRIARQTPQPPRALVSGFFEAQRLLINTHDIKALSFSTTKE